MLIAIEQTTYNEEEDKQETKIIYPLSPTTVRAMLRKNNVSIAKWFGKANCFHYRRGTLPSYGYFLFSGRDVPIITYPNGVATGPGSVSVIIDTFYNLDPDENVPMVPVDSTDPVTGKSALEDDNYKIRIENLSITEVEAITPSKGPTDAIYLVKVEDWIVSSWSHRTVDRNFNVPIGTYDNLVVPEETPECTDDETDGEQTELERNEEIEGLEVESIDIVYDPTTIKFERVSEGSSQSGDQVFSNMREPVTWKEMFQFIISQIPKDTWDITKLKDLDDTDVTYPLDSRSIEIVPEGVFFKAKPGDKPVTIKEALDYLFSITGYTIVRKPDGSFQLVQIDATEVDQLLEVDTDPISHFKDHLLKFDTHRTIFSTGTTIPRHIHFVFPKIWSTDPKDDKIEKVVVDDIIESIGHIWKVRALLYFHGKAVDTINNNGPVHEHEHTHHTDSFLDNSADTAVTVTTHTHEHAHDSTDSLPHTHTHDENQTDPFYENARIKYAQFFKGQLEAAWSGLGIELLDYECLTFLPLTPNHALSEVIWSFPGDGKPARTWLSTFPYEVSSIKDTPDVDRRGMQRIMISKTIPGDTWDDGEEDDEGAGSNTQDDEEELTPKLVPTEAKVWLLYPVKSPVSAPNSDGTHADGEPVKYEALAQIKVQHDFVAPIEIDAEKGRIGKCIDFQIMNVDCEQVKFIPPNTPDNPDNPNSSPS